jgi:hypothetical protein
MKRSAPQRIALGNRAQDDFVEFLNAVSFAELKGLNRSEDNMFMISVYLLYFMCTR